MSVAQNKIPLVYEPQYINTNWGAVRLLQYIFTHNYQLFTGYIYRYSPTEALPSDKESNVVTEYNFSCETIKNSVQLPSKNSKIMEMGYLRRKIPHERALYHGRLV